MIEHEDPGHCATSAQSSRWSGALRVLACLFALWGMGLACVPSPEGLPIQQPTGQPASFVKDVKPVLDRRCVVCHSCYNAACQLKLSSFEGAERGGSKDRVYD